MGHKSIWGDIKKTFKSVGDDIKKTVVDPAISTVSDPKFQKAVVSDLKIVGTEISKDVKAGADAYIDFQKDNLNMLKDAGNKALSFGGGIMKNIEQDMMIAGVVVGVIAIAYVYSSFKK